MKRITFFLCVCGTQSFGLMAMQPNHARTRSTTNPELLNLANTDMKKAQPEEPRTQSPKAGERIRKFALKERFKYTGEYKPIPSQNPE